LWVTDAQGKAPILQAIRHLEQEKGGAIGQARGNDVTVEERRALVRRAVEQSASAIGAKRDKTTAETLIFIFHTL